LFHPRARWREREKREREREVIDFECLALSRSLAYPAEVDCVSDKYEQGGVCAGGGGVRSGGGLSSYVPETYEQGQVEGQGVGGGWGGERCGGEGEARGFAELKREWIIAHFNVGPLVSAPAYETHLE
jgi:hypothetical protein